jgi:hypothetical protein
MVNYLILYNEEFISEEIESLNESIIILSESAYVSEKQRLKFQYCESPADIKPLISYYFRVSSDLQKGFIVASIISLHPGVTILSSSFESISKYTIKANTALLPSSRVYVKNNASTGNINPNEYSQKISIPRPINLYNKDSIDSSFEAISKSQAVEEKKAPALQSLNPRVFNPPSLSKSLDPEVSPASGGIPVVPNPITFKVSNPEPSLSKSIIPDAPNPILSKKPEPSQTVETSIKISTTPNIESSPIPDLLPRDQIIIKPPSLTAYSSTTPLISKSNTIEPERPDIKPIHYNISPSLKKKDPVEENKKKEKSELFIIGKNNEETLLISNCINSSDFDTITTLKDLFSIVHKAYLKSNPLNNPELNFKGLEIIKSAITSILSSQCFSISRNKTIDQLFSENCWDIELIKQ